MSLARTLCQIAAAADFRLTPTRQRDSSAAADKALMAAFSAIQDERAKQALVDLVTSVHAAEAGRRRLRLHAVHE